MNIQNILGQTVKSHTFKLNGGYQVFSLDLSELIAGNYVYSLVSGGVPYGSGKFIIVK